ncbi:unnamed protein product, partial [Rotaria sp. Silwood1]
MLSKPTIALEHLSNETQQIDNHNEEKLIVSTSGQSNTNID